MIAFIFFGFKKSALTPNAIKALKKKTIPDEYNPYPPKTHAYTVKDNTLMPPVTCRQAFVELGEPSISVDASQKIYSKAKSLF